MQEVKTTMRLKICLQWFVSEQVEEEETAQSMIDALKLIGDNGFGVYTMDKELGQRKYALKYKYYRIGGE